MERGGIAAGSSTSAKGSATRPFERLQRLDPTLERRLAAEARRGSRRARETLVESNIPLVIFIANQFKAALPLADRIQEGVTGLMRAAELFRPDKGASFGTYASRWILQSISRAVRCQSGCLRMPAKVHLRIRRADKAKRSLRQRLGRQPTLDEVSRLAGVDIPELERASAARRPAKSIEQGILADRRWIAALDDDESYSTPEAAAIVGDRRDRLLRSLDRLPRRERCAVCLRFGLCGVEPTTYQAIAVILGISRERVRQIVDRALRRIARECSALRADTF